MSEDGRDPGISSTASGVRDGEAEALGVTQARLLFRLSTGLTLAGRTDEAEAIDWLVGQAAHLPRLTAALRCIRDHIRAEAEPNIDLLHDVAAKALGSSAQDASERPVLARDEPNPSPPEPSAGWRGNSSSQSQPCGEASADAEVFAGRSSEPSAAEGKRYNREAMQHAVNVFAEIVGTLNITPSHAEIAKAVIRAGIRKLNLEATN